MTADGDRRRSGHRPDWVDAQFARAAAPDWWAWRLAVRLAGPAVSLLGRLQVTGGVDPALRRGPLILASNHIGNLDVVVLAAACHRLGLRPRYIVAGGLMRAPVLGVLLHRAGHIRVDRDGPDAMWTAAVATTALEHAAHVVVYPEGRIGLDPQMWPERGRTGVARLALTAGVPVLPVSQWGAHEAVAYGGRGAVARSMAGSLWRQPRLAVHVGPPVPLADLSAARVGDARRAALRITAAITSGLWTLRRDEPGLPHRIDPTRPVVPGGSAAHPGGQGVPGS